MKQVESMITANNLAELRIKLKVNKRVFYSLLLGDIEGMPMYGVNVPIKNPSGVPIKNPVGFINKTVGIPTTWQVANFIKSNADVLWEDNMCLAIYRLGGSYVLNIVKVWDKSIGGRDAATFDIETGENIQ